MPQFVWGPLPLQFLHPRADEFWRVLPLLVIPQFALTFGNSIVATENTAQILYGAQARRVTVRALSTSIALVNLASGMIQGAPMCHGSGGITAHYRFGARTAEIELHHRWAVYPARLVRKSGHRSPASYSNRHLGSVSDLRGYPARSLFTRHREASAASAHRGLRWGGFAADHQLDVGVPDGICPARNLADLRKNESHA